MPRGGPFFISHCDPFSCKFGVASDPLNFGEKAFYDVERIPLARWVRNPPARRRVVVVLASQPLRTAPFGFALAHVGHYSRRSNPKKRSNSFARQIARIKKNHTATAPMIAAMTNQGFVRTPK